MTVSLIISTYNWPAALELVLLSVAKQSILPEQIIIADDGSRQDTA
ncbi:glycosyltransferase, partial [Sphingobacterium shayense]